MNLQFWIAKELIKHSKVIEMSCKMKISLTAKAQNWAVKLLHNMYFPCISRIACATRLKLNHYGAYLKCQRDLTQV